MDMPMPKQSQAEFMKQYSEQRMKNKDIFGITHVALVCTCDCYDEPHWVAIRLLPGMVEDHLEAERFRAGQEILTLNMLDE